MFLKQKKEIARRRRPRITFINRFYWPDMSATSQILTDVTEALARNGYSVQVITSRLSYDGKSIYPKDDSRGNVQIRRVCTTRFGRNTNFGRALDYFTFYLSVSLFLVLRTNKNDIIVSKTDPPLLSIPLGLIARLKKAKLINWLQDIFPEVAHELGMLSSESTLAKILRSLRDRSLKRARVNVAIGHRMSETISKFGVNKEKIRIIENFVDDTAIVPRIDKVPLLRKEWNIKETDFVIGYSGNLGRAHDLSTVLEAATILKDNRDLKFLFIGGGFLRDHLSQEVSRRRLNNVVIKPYQPRERLPETLATPDLHWASLTPRLEGYIVPSKVYGVAAAGKPLLMIGDEDGEIGRMISQYAFGACIPPGHALGVANFILECQKSTEKTRNMGRQARKLIDERASRGLAITSWIELIDYVTVET